MSLVEELRVGSKVFVEDKNEGWITAEIIELDSNNADSILIRTNQDPAQVKIKQPNFFWKLRKIAKAMQNY